MKILLDTCVWGGAVLSLSEAGHDVLWTGDRAKDPGDEAILAEAHRDGRVLVTLDKDFGELVFLHRLPHPGIVRLVGFASREQTPACLSVLEAYAEELRRGALITAEPGRVRIREL
jgi:predicted nuclease of predicted toxin-antitoxin system